MGAHHRVEHMTSPLLQRLIRPGFIGFHHAGIADHIGDEDRNKAAVD